MQNHKPLLTTRTRQSAQREAQSRPNPVRCTPHKTSSAPSAFDNRFMHLASLKQQQALYLLHMCFVRLSWQVCFGLQENASQETSDKDVTLALKPVRHTSQKTSSARLTFVDAFMPLACAKLQQTFHLLHIEFRVSLQVPSVCREMRRKRRREKTSLPR